MPTLHAQAAAPLAELAAILYGIVQAELPVDRAQAEVLDALFDLVAALEAIAGCEIGPLPRAVLGDESPL